METKKLSKITKEEIILAVFQWLGTSVLVFFVQYKAQLTRDSIIYSFVLSFSFTILWNVFVRSFGILFQKYYSHLLLLINRINDTRLTVSERTLLQAIVETKPLYNYYSDLLDKMTNNISTLIHGASVKLDPFNIYNYIISASASFTKSIHSIDCNINAWINVCEFEDYAIVYNLSESDEKYRILKEEYETGLKKKRRTDSTYQIYDSIKNNLVSNESIINLNPVKRIFLLTKRISELTKEERMIILRLQKIKNEIRGKIENKILIREDLDSKDKEKLDELQDIIIFDGVVAYKEYFYPEDLVQDSEIFLERKRLNKYIQYFNELFDKSKDINKIKF